MATGALAAATIGSAAIASKSAKSQNKATRSSAQTQARASDRAIAEQSATRRQIRRDLAPARRIAGDPKVFERLSDLIQHPSVQAGFVRKSPFFEAMAGEAQTRLFQNQAARGKLGSGETAKALQNSLFLLGSDIVNQSIQQRLNLATLGLNAAAQTGASSLQSASNISDLMTQRGNVQAAGIAGQRSPLLAGLNTGLQTGTSLYSLFGGRTSPAPITTSTGTAPTIFGGGGAPVFASI